MMSYHVVPSSNEQSRDGRVLVKLRIPSLHSSQVSSLCNWPRLPVKGLPFMFVGVEGKDERTTDYPGYMNKHEAAQIVEMILDLLRHNGVVPSDIAVVTAFHRQTLLIRKLLTKKDVRGVEVAGVESIQGRELKAVFVSVVRARKIFIEYDQKFSLGFLFDQNKLNTALTRATSLLVMVADPYIACEEKHWRQLLERCSALGCYEGPEFTSANYKQNREAQETKINQAEAEEQTKQLNELSEQEAHTQALADEARKAQEEQLIKSTVEGLKMFVPTHVRVQTAGATNPTHTQDKLNITNAQANLTRSPDKSNPSNGTAQANPTNSPAQCNPTNRLAQAYPTNTPAQVNIINHSSTVNPTFPMDQARIKRVPIFQPLPTGATHSGISTPRPHCFSLPTSHFTPPPSFPPSTMHQLLCPPLLCGATAAVGSGPEAQQDWRPLLMIGSDGSLSCNSPAFRPFLSVSCETFAERSALLITVCAFGMQSNISRGPNIVQISLHPREDSLCMLPAAVDTPNRQSDQPFQQLALRLCLPTEVSSASLQCLSEEHAIKLFFLADEFGRVVHAKLAY
ncbi:MAG: hypothetical protein SGPRY_007338 [Prymnesium sp.]